MTPRGIRLGVRRVLGDPAFAARAREMRDWAAANDGAANAADAVEQLAAGRKSGLADPGDRPYAAPR